MSKNRIKINVTQDEAELEKGILESYEACLLNTIPKSEAELFQRYQKNTEILYQYLRAVTVDFIYPLNNEIRAMFGHLAELSKSEYRDVRELERANGHFRRLNIDALKMICDDFDKYFWKKLNKHSKYDYRNVDSKYLEEFGAKYFKAQKAYLNAQENESVGSDSKDEVGKEELSEKDKKVQQHNVIKLYHDAVKEYILLKQFYMGRRRIIESEQRKTNFKKIVSGVIVAFGLVISAWEIKPTIIQWIANIR